ncbi:MAG: DUF2800 domain-containing protein [bacterium]
MKHLTYGGSSAARTEKCPGWIEQSKDIPRHPVGQAAIDGSMHHEVQQKVQEQGKNPADFLGLVYEEGDGRTVQFKDEHLDMADALFAHTEDILDKYEIEDIMVEPFVQLVPDLAGGSIDLLGISKDKTLALFLDYKTGRHGVKPKENSQCFMYAASAMTDPLTKHLFDKVKTIIFVIVQPPCGKQASQWKTTPARVRKWEKKFKQAMDSREIHPGGHCQYCPAAPTCATKRADVVAAMAHGGRGRADLQASADMVAQVEDWVKSVKQELYFQLGEGTAIKGWKIVDRVAKRKWINEGIAKAAMMEYGFKESEITTTTLMTAPQCEALMKKQKLPLQIFDPDHEQALVDKKSSGTTLAPADSEGEAVVPSENPDNLKALVTGAA